MEDKHTNILNACLRTFTELENRIEEYAEHVGGCTPECVKTLNKVKTAREKIATIIGEHERK